MLESNSKNKNSEINMKYIEGVVKICLKKGYWLFLDNINLARPEIIERLNSLGEDSLCLFINEFDDSNRRIIPHQQFRLICIQNPQRAESHLLSPAFYSICQNSQFQNCYSENPLDIIDILVKNGEGYCLFQEETVKLAEKFLKNIDVQTLQMKIQCQFQNQILQAKKKSKIKLEQKFEVGFNQKNEISIAQMIEQLIGAQCMQLFASFKSMFEEAMYECQLLQDEIQEIKLIIISMNFHCSLSYQYLQRLWVFYLLQNLELKQLQNEISYFDFQEKKIELNIGSQSSIQIFKLTFLLSLIKLMIFIIIRPIVRFNGMKKMFVLQKAVIDNLNKQIFKLQIGYEQPLSDQKNVLCQFFEQYFEKNYFISKLVDMKELIIKKLDIITNALFWNFQMEIQLNLGFKIFEEITFSIKSIGLYWHNSIKCEFSIVSTIEFFKFIMEIGIDFFLIFLKLKIKSLKTIFRKAHDCPTFKEILFMQSPAIDSVLEKIPSYKGLKSKISVNRFTKLGSSIFEEFILQAYERVQCTERQIKEDFDNELIKGKEQTKMMLKYGIKIVNQQIQIAKDKVNQNINELNQNLKQKKLNKTQIKVLRV